MPSEFVFKMWFEILSVKTEILASNRLSGFWKLKIVLFWVNSIGADIMSLARSAGISKLRQDFDNIELVNSVLRVRLFKETV